VVTAAEEEADMKYTQWWLLVLMLLLTLAMPIPAGAEGKPAATVAVDRDTLTVTANIAVEHLSLRLATPDGYVFVTESAGTPLALNPFTIPRYVAPDGNYVWEVRVTPKGAIDPRIQERAKAARESGEVGAEHELRLALNRAVVLQSGGFKIINGKVVMGGPVEPQRRPKDQSGLAPRAPFGPAGLSADGDDFIQVDQVIPDDLIVQGSACVGLDCVNNENFGFDTIRLKENNLRIHFDDTSAIAGFPANDWRLIANDSASGGQSKFSIEDSTGARTPFTVEAGATTNSLYVDSTGRVGFRTSTPVLDLHVNTSNTPGLRLEQNNSGGFTAQTWDIAGNEANFFVRDVTSGSRLPFRIRPGAPTSSIDIAADGDVGIGTGAPGARLHVFSTETADVFASFGPNPGSGPALNVAYGGATFGRGAAFLNARPDASAAAPNPSLRFLTANLERMIISNQGFVGIGAGLNPIHPLQLTSGAHVTAGGVWTNASSRELKDDIQTLTADEARATLSGLSPVKFAYKVDPTERHVGFVAEDVPGLVATRDRTSLSPMDIVAVLTRVLQEQQKTIEAQQQTVATQQRLIDELATKVSTLEAAQPR
jgi:hypothetical protein